MSLKIESFTGRSCDQWTVSHLPFVIKFGVAGMSVIAAPAGENSEVPRVVVLADDRRTAPTVAALRGAKGRVGEEVVAILDRAHFLNPTRNPAISSLRASTEVAREAASVLIQYGYLPGVIAEFLCRGVVKLNAWPAVRDELLKNLGEELGSRSGGSTHFEILKSCLRAEAGLDLDAGHVPAEATTVMIRNVRMRISDRSLHEAAGALYALEASAVPELKVVAHLINIYATKVLGGPLVSENYDTCDRQAVYLSHRPLVPTQYPAGAWTLSEFLAAHIDDFEKYHRDELADALEKFTDGDHENSLFVQGFSGVVDEMERWWAALAQVNRAS